MKLAAKIAGVVYRWELSEVALRLARQSWNNKAAAGKQVQIRCSLLFSPCFAGKNVQNFGLIRDQGA